MKKIGFITLGCKVNTYEANALKNELMALGYLVGECDESCVAYIINTCTVTNMADSKSRKMINKCIKMNPKAVICAMGCYVQTNEGAKNIEGVDILLGNGNKKEAIKKLDEMIKNGKESKYVNILDILNTHEFESFNVTSYDHTRAFIKIEDGCENFCTYCIIPYARGPVRCKEADKVIEELLRITNEGYKEVVLSGIHTGRYNDNGINFSKLVKRILNEVPKLKRLRVSSIEINEVDDEFISLMKENKVIANHIHLPLQSGSDLVLEKMERRYDKAYFKERVIKIKEARPDISLTTDVIVGFPYESDECYNETKEFVKEIGLTKLHVFPYSMRRGTKASTMPQVNDTVKKNRAKDLINFSNELEKEYYLKFIGKELDVIVEQIYDDNYMIGHTSNFLQVLIPFDNTLIGKQVLVKLINYNNGKIISELISIIE